MGFEYAFVHVQYTIPPALLLSLLYRPLFTRLDLYKITFLITVAVTSTIPWDSYLIRRRIWSYPPDVVVGLTVFDIPIEEVFFFVIQTYNTSILYLILNKSTFHPAYLRSSRHCESLKICRTLGQIVLVSSLAFAALLVRHDGVGTYFGLIVGWAAPFLLLLWTLGYQFLIGLPWTNTLLPIAVPTIYLWVVDTFALRRGTWVIEEGTKLGICLWAHLEIEEAIFFLITNCMIVFGLVAFDNALAIMDAFAPNLENMNGLPSPILLVQALLKPTSGYDENRINGLREAVQRLKMKSRSFYIASGAFEGKLRIDLILLYSYCRVADDLVDNATSSAEAKAWIYKLRRFLDISYGPQDEETSLSEFVTSNFPRPSQSTLLLLPTACLTKEPLYDLLEGFEMDLAFTESYHKSRFPIKNEADLEVYGARVAGTVAHLCLDLVFHHAIQDIDSIARDGLIRAGETMGIALQLVNIARDIVVDAKMNRVYLPGTWLDETGLTQEAILKDPSAEKIDQLRRRLLEKAFRLYYTSRGAIDKLPAQAKGPIRVAVESYMEIGRVLRDGYYPTKEDRATVPTWRRVLVAWRALLGPPNAQSTESI